MWLAQFSPQCLESERSVPSVPIRGTAKIEEIDMSEKFSNFCGELRTKINDADKRIKDLKANAVVASEKAKVEARAQLAALENKAKEHKARAVATNAKVKAWVEEKKTMTHDKIAQWTRLKERPSKPWLPAWMPTASRRRPRARAPEQAADRRCQFRGHRPTART